MKKGFTVIELLIVVAMIGFLAGLSYFGYSSVRNSLDVNYAAKQVFADTRLTQELAKTVHYPHQIEFTKDGREYHIINLEDDSAVKSASISAGLVFEGKGTFIFSASGNPVAGGSGTMMIRNNKGAVKSIIVSPAGRIRIE